MRKFVSGTSLLSAMAGCLLLAACGSSSSTRVVSNQVPAVVKLSATTSCLTTTNPADVSLEVGKTQNFTPCAFNSGGTPLAESFTYQSSAPNVLTIANNGQACAGTWDSITAPSVCTPGATGVVQITAQANGVLSPAINVYVHQHITNILVSKVPNQPPTLSTSCLTKAAPLLGPGPESLLYEAFAFSGSADITSTVGPFTWQSVALPGQTNGATSVSLAAAPANSPQCLKGIQGQCLNEELAMAATPGATEIIASAGGVNSQPVSFVTCPVQSISVTPANNSSSTLFTVPSGTSTVLNATVKDTLGMTLTGVPLTWSASTPASVSVSGVNTGNVYASVGTVSSSAVGGGSVTVSCTPPGCNGGITPSLPIYSPQAFGFTVTGTSSATTTNPTVYAASTACSTTTQGCTARMISITRSSTTAPFTAGSAVNLPFAPNSLQLDPKGANAYLGVQSTAFGTQGLMTFNGSSVSQQTNAAGKVLAVSPDGTTVILSDTADSPPRVFVVTNSGGSAAPATFMLPNAVSAAFSPDGLKAYIVSAGACPGSSSAGCLLIYSKVDAARTIPLATPPTDAAFIGNGTVGYVAGGSAAGSSFYFTCDDPTIVATVGSLNLASQVLRPLPDGQSLLSLSPPDVQKVTATISGTPSPNVPGCPAPRGFLNVTNTVSPPINLGQGNFTPTQFLVSADGSMAYILGRIQQAVSFPVMAATCVVNASGTGCASPYVTYTYAWTSGPAVALGTNITVAGVPTADSGTFPVIGVSGPAPIGSGGAVGTFTVANSSGIPASGLSGTASGTETLNFNFVLAFNLQSQTSFNISLLGGATPLSASISPAGNLLFVGADDNQVHVIDTATQTDTDQVPLTFPQNSSLCVGPGSPPTALQSLLAIVSASQDPTTSTTTFTYSLNSGPPVAVGNPVKVSGMSDPGNNGTFVATSVGTGSFTAINPIGVTATSQNGTGSAGLACSPDLVVVKP